MPADSIVTTALSDHDPEPPMTFPPAETSPSPQLSPPPRRRVLRNVMFSVLGKLQGALFAYATTYLLLQAFAVEQYGLYALLFGAAVTNLSYIARMGLTSLLSRFIPEYYYQSKYRLIARLFWASNLVQMGFAALLLALVFIFATPISLWIKFPGSETTLRIFAAGAFTFLLAENYRTLLAGMFMHNTVFFRDVIYNAVRLALIFYVTRLPDPLLPVIIAETCMFAFSMTLYIVAYRKTVRPLVATDVHPQMRPPWRRFSRYTVYSYFNELGVMLLNSATDLFLVTGLLGGFAAGLYGLANRILGLVQTMLPSQFLSTVITPLFFSEYGANPRQARFGFALLIKSSLLITIPLGIWLALMARPVITELFDPRYVAAAEILVIAGLFLPMQTLRYPLGLMLQNAERNDLLLWTKLLGVAKIGLGVWLIPVYGFLAMVWITQLAITAQNLLLYFWIVTILRSGMDLRGVLKLAINGIVSGGILYLLAPWLTGLVGLLLSVVVFAALFFGLCAIHRGFTAEERAFINSKLAKPVWIF